MMILQNATIMLPTMNLLPLTPPTASHPRHVVAAHYYLAVDGPADQVVRAPVP